MIITGYSSLLQAVEDYLARSDLGDHLPNFVQNWESRFYRAPENYGPWMEKSFSETMAAGEIDVPTDYLALKRAALPRSRPLDRVSSNQLYGRYPLGCSSGKPVLIARDGNKFVFGPAPDSDYQVSGMYWAKPVALRSAPNDATDHWIIQNAPDLPLYGALLEAQPFLLNDKRISTWGSLYDIALGTYRNMIRDEDISGSAPQEFLA